MVDLEEKLYKELADQIRIEIDNEILKTVKITTWLNENKDYIIVENDSVKILDPALELDFITRFDMGILTYYQQNKKELLGEKRIQLG